MKVRLNRFVSSSNDSLGMLYIDGKFAAFTVEDEKRDVKVMGETRIPAGIYKLSLVESPKYTARFGHKMIMLNGVPGFTGVLIHPGNTEKDTMGCIPPGNVVRYNPDGGISRIEESIAAYKRIYPIIAGAIETEGADIEVIDSDY